MSKPLALAAWALAAGFMTGPPAEPGTSAEHPEAPVAAAVVDRLAGAMAAAGAKHIRSAGAAAPLSPTSSSAGAAAPLSLGLSLASAARRSSGVPGTSAEAPAAPGGHLTTEERWWIGAAAPVLRRARELGIAIDIVVQLGPQPDAPPIGLGIQRGGCKLLLSLRGNPAADTLLAAVRPTLFSAVAEAIVAHEVAHCWRWTQGSWKALPSGLVDLGDDPGPSAAVNDPTARREMRQVRREEAFADLVALAWTAREHPGAYVEVQAWLEAYRGDARPGDHHDTGVWLRLAREASAFGSSGSLFRDVEPVWESGLRAAGAGRSLTAEDFAHRH